MAFLFILPTWPIDVWTAAMKKVAPDIDLRVWPDRMGNVDDIEYCAAWLPPPGVVKSLPNLKVIMSLGAGVDAILKDETLPKHLPIVRVNDPDLTGRMTEYVVLHVLMHHRQQRRIDENQKKRVWDSFATHAAKDLSVGIMGMGVMGADSAIKLRDIGFRVAGWSRSRKVIPGVESFAGAAEFDAFLARTDVLVSLLPATPDTDGIINRDTIRKLSRKGPFGAPDHHQCRARAPAGGGRHSGRTRCRRASCRDARRVHAGTTAAGQPVVDAPEGDGDAALRRRQRPRNDLRLCGEQHPAGTSAARRSRIWWTGRGAIDSPQRRQYGR